VTSECCVRRLLQASTRFWTASPELVPSALL
jgi:hypothetical protein